MKRRSFLKATLAAIASVAVLGATSVAEVVEEPAMTGLEAWLPEPGATSFFGTDRVYFDSVDVESSYGIDSHKLVIDKAAKFHG